jgi:hypothetical protein
MPGTAVDQTRLRDLLLDGRSARFALASRFRFHTRSSTSLKTAMSLFQIAFLIFAAGAGGGVLFTALLALGVRYPRWMGAGHGTMGLLALAVLGYALSQAPADAGLSRAWWALGVFALALLGGLTLFRFLFPQRRPLVLALLHGGLALIGLYLLYPVAFAVAPT